MPQGLHGVAPPLPPMPQGLQGVAPPPPLPPPMPQGLHGISPPLTPTGLHGVTPASVPQGLLGLAPGLGSQSIAEYAAAAAAAANYAAAYAAAAYKAGAPQPVEGDEGYEAVCAAFGGEASSPMSSPNLAPSPTTSPSMDLATSPTGARRRGTKNPVPAHLKDARYFEKRQKNNLAAKKSRDARRAREKSNELEKEKLEAEVAQLRALVNQEHAENNALERILNGQGIPTPDNLVPEVMRMFKAASDSPDPAVAQQLAARAYKLMEVSGSQYRRQRQMLLQMHATGQLLPPKKARDPHSRPSDEQRRQNDV